MPNIRAYKADRLVYDAEDCIPIGRTFSSIEDVREYVGLVVSSVWWRDRCVLEKVSVMSPRMKSYGWSATGAAAIWLPEWGWNERVILHELAHQLVDSRHQYDRHGPKFRYWLARLIEQFHSHDMVGSRDILTHMVEGFLAKGYNLMEAQAICESENLRRSRPAPVEEGPVWRSVGTVSYKTHIPVPEVHIKVVQAGKTVSSFVRAMGGDKGKNEPIAEWWRPVYVSGSRGMRWLSRECLNHFDQLTESRRGK